MNEIRNGITTLAWHGICGMIVACLTGLIVIWTTSMPEWMKLAAGVVIVANYVYSIGMCTQACENLEVACRNLDNSRRD